MRFALAVWLGLGATACGDSAPGTESPSPDAGQPAVDGAPTTPDASGDARSPDATPAGTCAPGGAGLECLFDLYDEVASSCDPTRLDDLRISLAARHGDLPAWYAGRALFVADGPVAFAGTFNDWQADALVASALCGSELFMAESAVSSGRHAYKIVRDGVWELDPENWAFAYDDYEGNADGKNSVLNTYDSGVGHLVQPEQELCSTELGNCRPLTTYLPPGYGAPENAQRHYPVIFMHDGQNIFDDHDCCFGHTGWEVNVQLDSDIAAGLVEPAVVVGFDHGGAQRGDEYAYSTAVGGLQEVFMEFQVNDVQPAAAAYWRLDSDRVYVAGSSFGGLVSMRLAFAYPDTYRGAASLSGAFWPGQEDGTALRDVVSATGAVAVALYLDHGGTAETGADGYFDNLEMLDILIGLGWQRQNSPDCTLAADSLCYFHDVGATHDELAWRDRSYRFLRYFLGVDDG